MFIESGRIYPTAPLKQLCSKIGSGATPKGGKTAYQESGISLIRSTNVFDYVFSYNALAHISDEQADQLSNVVVEEKDVLFNITGVSVTRCCIVPADVLPARVNQHVMILRPNAAMPMSYYIMTTLCSAENKAKLMGIAQSGSTREAINKQEMEFFSIPLPSPSEIRDFEIKAHGLYKTVIQNTEEIMQLNVMQQLLLSQLSSR
jgi:type I restriction enzyme, S subunit